MRKMRLVFTADFEIPDNVIIHDDGIFECEGVMFNPELHFDCVEFDPFSPEEPLRFPNDVVSVEQYEIGLIDLNCKIDLLED